VGLNCSRDVECRHWVDSRKQWEREGCLNVAPPGGVQDGFLYCDCYLAGTIAGIANPWYWPPIPKEFAIFGNPDILQALPQIAWPINAGVAVTVAFIALMDLGALIWAKFRVHRRKLLKQRANDARRKLARMSHVSSTVGDEPMPKYLRPTTGQLKYLGMEKGGEEPPSEGGGGGISKTMLMTVVAAAQRKTQMQPAETIQERVSIEAMIEAAKQEQAASPDRTTAAASSPDGKRLSFAASITANSRESRRLSMASTTDSFSRRLSSASSFGGDSDPHAVQWPAPPASLCNAPYQAHAPLPSLPKMPGMQVTAYVPAATLPPVPLLPRPTIQKRLALPPIRKAPSMPSAEDTPAEPTDDGTRPLPSAGWERIPSQSRPGQFSYLHVPTGLKQARFPRGDPPKQAIRAAHRPPPPIGAAASAAHLLAGIGLTDAAEEMQERRARIQAEVNRQLGADDEPEPEPVLALESHPQEASGSMDALSNAMRTIDRCSSAMGAAATPGKLSRAKTRMEVIQERLDAERPTQEAEDEPLPLEAVIPVFPSGQRGHVQARVGNLYNSSSACTPMILTGPPVRQAPPSRPTLSPKDAAAVFTPPPKQGRPPTVGRDAGMPRPSMPIMAALGTLQNLEMSPGGARGARPMTPQRDDGRRPLPSKHWQRIPSRSRPGEYAYVHAPSGLRQAKFPEAEPSQEAIQAALKKKNDSPGGYSGGTLAHISPGNCRRFNLAPKPQSPSIALGVAPAPACSANSGGDGGGVSPLVPPSPPASPPDDDATSPERPGTSSQASDGAGGRPWCAHQTDTERRELVRGLMPAQKSGRAQISPGAPPPPPPGEGGAIPRRGVSTAALGERRNRTPMQDDCRARLHARRPASDGSKRSRSLEDLFAGMEEGGDAPPDGTPGSQAFSSVSTQPRAPNAGGWCQASPQWRQGRGGPCQVAPEPSGPPQGAQRQVLCTTAVDTASLELTPAPPARTLADAAPAAAPRAVACLRADGGGRLSPEPEDGDDAHRQQLRDSLVSTPPKATYRKSRSLTPSGSSRGLVSSASSVQLGGGGCKLSQDETGDSDVERALTPSGTMRGGLASGGRVPAQQCAMPAASWFASAGTPPPRPPPPPPPPLHEHNDFYLHDPNGGGVDGRDYEQLLSGLDHDSAAAAAGRASELITMAPPWLSREDTAAAAAVDGPLGPGLLARSAGKGSGYIFGAPQVDTDVAPDATPFKGAMGRVPMQLQHWRHDAADAADIELEEADDGEEEPPPPPPPPPPPGPPPPLPPPPSLTPSRLPTRQTASSCLDLSMLAGASDRASGRNSLCRTLTAGSLDGSGSAAGSFSKRGSRASEAAGADAKKKPKLNLANKWRGAGVAAANTAKLKAAFTPPKAPPPPTAWSIIKNEHLLVATFWSADANYAKVQKGHSQLRETQLVQVVFNTTMFELGLVVLLGARFSDLDAPLSVAQVVAASTLACFVCCVASLLWKGLFRWGNVSRRALRRQAWFDVARRRYEWAAAIWRGDELLHDALMKAWWHHRMAPTKRKRPKKALSSTAQAVRRSTAWVVVALSFVGSMALERHLLGRLEEGWRSRPSSPARSVSHGSSQSLPISRNH